MISDLDLFTPPDGDDGSTSVVCLVQAVDVAGRLVQVTMPGDSTLWLPAQPGRYRIADAGVGGGLARVLADGGRPLLVLGPLDPLDPVVPASMTAIGATTATVSWNGAGYTLPFVPATYGTLPRDVWIALSDWGTPVLVHGPSATAPPPPPPPPPDPTPGATVQVTQAIAPQWSGTYRHIRAAYDRWNTDRYGGRSTLYQGDAFGSGPLTGLAVYGDQLVNLGAISFDRVAVMLRPVLPGGSGGPPMTVQAAANGTPPSGAPTVFGPTVSGAGGWVDLTSDVAEAMRTGGVKGLATVGGNYWAVAGAGNGDGMLLSVTYTRYA
ncbi:hypothetical protein ABRQ22_17210 [Cellulosimicrobium sp. ES-005]|uniref:Minor tail protein n=1 Tax=Cellulosimicrobium sp. ES-005 TaxID=3163031 RepID=A0AAU8FXT9_9MICO